MEPIENLPPVKIGPRVEREIRARIRELKERLSYNKGMSRYIRHNRLELEKLEDFLRSLCLPDGE
jgi:hypothetical protein